MTRESPGRQGSADPETELFWEDPAVVETFAGRPPDHRLQRMVEGVRDPSLLRALDVGCAGGRNTVFLARAGADVHAVDASAAMVERTRASLAEIVGEEGAAARVVRGPMHDLGHIPDDSVDLVVVLGVLQSARTVGEWRRTVAELHRVLKPGGRALVSNFAPASRPRGRPLAPVDGESDRYLWREGQRMVLLEPERHDAEFRGLGLRPVEPTDAVRVPLEEGYRISINALYEKG